MENIMLSLNT